MQGLGSVRTLRYLEDLWDESGARGPGEADVLRAGDRSPAMTGHVIPVDGGFVEAFRR